MRKALAPWAIGAAGILVASLVVLASALGGGGLLQEIPDRTGAATPAPALTRAPAELSRAGRIAYWRTEPNGDNRLWVANADGSQQQSLARVDDLSRVSFTRWSPDGAAIAYLDTARSAVVIRLDGSRVELPLPVAVQTTGARFSDLAWSTDSRSLGATLLAGSLGRLGDVYVTGARGGEWRNATNLGSALLAEWISADELLIQTFGGLIAVESADGTRLRPLTGLSATSPFLADDGRIHFLAGQIAPAVRDQAVPVINASQARVWSVTVDGGDARMETTQTYDDVRLAGRWPDGRYYAHQGASIALAFLGGSGQQLIDARLGIVDRILVAPDKRSAVGSAGTRIVRYDTAEPQRPTVLLDNVAQPDAWFPRDVVTSRAAPAAAATRPAARYAFVVGGFLWTMDANGDAKVVARSGFPDGSSSRFSVLAPFAQWSPAGDRILFFDVLPQAYGFVNVVDPRGNAIKVSGEDAAGPAPAWTPDGNVAYANLAGARDSSTLGAAGEVRIVAAADPTQPLLTYRAREVAPAGGRTFLIDNGRFEPGSQSRVGHAIVEALSAGGLRKVVDADALAGAASLGPTPQRLSSLAVSADGAYLSVRLSAANGQTALLAIVRTTDGVATVLLAGAPVSDIRWAPSGHRYGMTLQGGVSVRDGAAFAPPVASQSDGRFAGWSPDGAWYYVAKPAGLFAYRTGGGEGVRISPLGVPVSTTLP